MNCIEENIQQLLNEYPEIVSAFLYGSEAAGRAGPHSDLDIALLYSHGKDPSYSEKLKIEDKLTSSLGREVDLLILNNASPIIRMQVLKKGKKVLDRSSRETNSFFVQTVNEYCDLKMTRSIIEESLGHSRIYG